ncbi:DUF5659 domain-containing protein [Sutcliffiella sp. BMC8]|uniref:DUF5659 domain-containing protein n=1 Tax=unclassified Sutcliffiella TaxID=2837532 RepID=UPI0033780858
MENFEKDRVVFSQKLAGYLMMNGCKLKNISLSKKDNTKFVYFFNDNKQVSTYIDHYSLKQ